VTHPVVHFEIGCRDSAKTQEFYKKLFDWKISEMGPAAMIAAESGGIDGHITALGHDPQHYTIFYVAVDDVAGYLEKAARLGAKNARTSRRHPHRHLRLDRGSRRQYRRAMEGQVLAVSG